MSKIVRAANAMVSHPEKIDSVVPGQYGNEIYFIFDYKHKWSIGRNEDLSEYWLVYYPDNVSIQELAMLHPDGWDRVNLVSYSSKAIGTKEARETFSELYTLVQEKVYGIDAALDEIISIDEIPF